METQQIITEEEAIEILLDRSQIDPNAEKVLGKDLYNELIELFEDEEILELDLLFLTGQLSLEEMQEYLLVSPHYHELMRKFKDWAEKYITKVIKNLPQIYNRSRDRKGRINNNNGIIRRIRDTYTVIESFSNRGYTNKRNSLMSDLRNYIGNNLFLDIWYATVLNPRLADNRDLLDIFIRNSNRNFLNRFKYSSPSFVAATTLSTFKKAYAKHQEALREFLNKVNTHQNKEDLKSDIEEDFRVISELSHFREIDPHREKVSNVEAEIYYSNKKFRTRASHIAFIKISFPGAKSDVRISLTEELENYDHICVTHNEINSFQFRIDRHTGELEIGNSRVTLDKQVRNQRGKPFISEEEFLRLKSYIFKLIRKQLESKPEDITSAFDPKYMPRVQEAINERTKGVIPEEIPEEKDIKIPEYIYKPYQADKEEVTETESAKPTYIIQDVELRANFDEARSVSAIKNLSKSSRNGKGSHVVITGHNGRRFPLPNHKNKDIAKPILRRALEILEIKHSDFISAY